MEIKGRFDCRYKKFPFMPEEDKSTLSIIWGLHNEKESQISPLLFSRALSLKVYKFSNTDTQKLLTFDPNN